MFILLFAVWVVGFIVTVFSLVIVDNDLSDEEILLASVLWCVVLVVLSVMSVYRCAMLLHKVVCKLWKSIELSKGASNES